MAGRAFFSVVIPTYNRSDLVQCAINSVRRQTFQDFEIVVSDNCSSDDTRAAVEQIPDSRIRYFRAHEHLKLSDNWEGARRRATGRYVVMLADDDALVGTALERFASEQRRTGAEFLFSELAEYRDAGYPGPNRNTVECEPFTGRSFEVSADEFVRSLLSFRPVYNMHPSAYTFSSELAETIAQRCGRFFKTMGVEYFVWPLAAVFANRIVHIDAPLALVGRTVKSWGTNMVLTNPGEDKIRQFVADADTDRLQAPLMNFTFANLMIEGIMTAKGLFPAELAEYEVDEEEYLRATLAELRSREALGVDVSEELEELGRYWNEWRERPATLRRAGDPMLLRVKKAVARRVGTTGLGHLTSPQVPSPEDGWAGLRASGDAEGFDDILGASGYVDRALEARVARPVASSPPVAKAE